MLSQALNSISEVKSVFGDDEKIRKGLEKFILQLIEKPLNQLGWEPADGEEFNTRSASQASPRRCRRERT